MKHLAILAVLVLSGCASPQKSIGPQSGPGHWAKFCETCGGYYWKLDKPKAPTVEEAMRHPIKEPWQNTYDPEYGSTDHAVWMRKHVYHWSPPVNPASLP